MTLPSRLSRLVSAIAPPDDIGGRGDPAPSRQPDQAAGQPGPPGGARLAAGRRCAAARRSVARPVIFTFAADHGVVAEGVSAYPQSVTAQMVENFLRGGAAVNVLARDAGARVVVADFGVANPVARLGGPRRLSPRSGHREHGPGPGHEPRRRRSRRLEAGARLAEEAIAEGADLLGTGEMGIGNTTAASAITAAITGAPAEAVTGRGTGIDEAAWRRKVEVVERALAVNRPDPAGRRGRPRQGRRLRDRRPGRRRSWPAPRTACPSSSTASSPPPRRSSPSPWRRPRAGCCFALPPLGGARPRSRPRAPRAHALSRSLDAAGRGDRAPRSSSIWRAPPRASTRRWPPSSRPASTARDERRPMTRCARRGRELGAVLALTLRSLTRGPTSPSPIAT